MDNIQYPYDFCKNIECSECHFTNYGKNVICNAVDQHKNNDKLSMVIALLENTDSDFIHVGKLLSYIRGL